MSINTFQRYIWLIETISRHQPISYNDINSLWVTHPLSEQGSIELAKRTFHDHKQLISRIFNINIKCDGYNRYYIENTGAVSVDSNRSIMVESLSTYNLLMLQGSLQPRISLEYIPGGNNWLPVILEAMKLSRKVSLKYNVFYSDKIEELVVEPYFLKIFKHRWYMVARSSDIKIYALDRIEHIAIVKQKFTMPGNFHPEDYFLHCFGIYNESQVKPVRVLLRANQQQSKYIKALPLHSSQIIREQSQNHTYFELFLKPSLDFIQELLSMGASIEVLEPDTLREEMRQRILSMSNNYK